MKRFQQTRVIVIGILILALIALVAQNTESVETRFLFIRFTMPRAALLLVSYLAGLFTGLLVAGRIMRRGKK